MNAVPASIALLFLSIGSVVILWGLLSPPENLPAWSRSHDKLLHALAFALLAVLASMSWPDIDHAKMWVWLVLVGLGSECLQQLSPHRKFCWRDTTANAIGAAMGLGLVSFANAHFMS